jgi:hypothetical protein
MTDRIQELMDQCWDPGRGVVNPRKLAYRIIKESVHKMESEDSFYGSWMGRVIKEHFGLQESKGWVCPKCGVDRTKEACPSGYNSLLVGQCPMVGESQ